MSTLDTTTPEEWRDLACDWRGTWGRCFSLATHGLFVGGTGTPFAARCRKHIEQQRQATLSKHPTWTVDVRPLVVRATPRRR